jgi:hypothetical protein
VISSDMERSGYPEGSETLDESDISELDAIRYHPPGESVKRISCSYGVSSEVLTARL